MVDVHMNVMFKHVGVTTLSTVREHPGVYVTRWLVRAQQDRDGALGQGNGREFNKEILLDM